MISNKKTAHNRSSRIHHDSTKNSRSSTPQHHQMQRSTRISQSQSKNAPSIIIPTQMPLLTPIIEQQYIHKPYYLGKGNNHEVVKRCMDRRQGWGQVATNTDFVFFRWVQSSYSFKFHLLGKECYCFNHFQYHRELSNKQRLVTNMANFCEANKLNVFSFLPVSFIIDLNTGEEDLALHAFIKFFNRNYPDDNPSRRYQTIILPRSRHIPYHSAQQLNKRSQGNFYCKPTFSKSFTDMETKSYLWILKPTFLNRGRGVVLFKELDELEKLIWKYYEGEGLEDYSQKQFTTTFKEQQGNMKDSINEESEDKKTPSQIILQKKQADKKPQQSKQAEKKQAQKTSEVLVKEQNNKNATELSEDSNKTAPASFTLPSLKKIESTNSDNAAMKNSMMKKTEDEPSSTGFGPSSPSKIVNQNSRCLSFIIQKYIEKPMLIGSRKFDIRVWVLLTQNLEVYAFQEAYLRFSSQPYSTKDNHTNPFIHLTNNSVQKHNADYDKSSGNQDRLSSIWQHMPAGKENSTYKSIVNKIKEIIWLSMCAVRRKININSRKECFECFGYDFMIDCDYKVWLIEVNTNPSIDESGPLLRQLVPRMIDDMFKLTIDKIFNNKIKEDAEVLAVDGVEHDHNMWQFLGDLKEGANERNGRRLTFARR